ncbi:MAG: hypothetical protein K9N06_08835 [Candidatus Cloacimonetes bacterium]|nr:hypothetical protein [Candidatus Cloacimonadota bacterium]
MKLVSGQVKFHQRMKKSINIDVILSGIDAYCPGTGKEIQIEPVLIE